MGRKTLHFPNNPKSFCVLKVVGICALKLNGTIKKTHPFLVVPNLPHCVYIGSGILVRFGFQLDTINNVLWSLTTLPQDTPLPDLDYLRSGQIIPEVCHVANNRHITVPAWTLNKPVPIHILAGQTLSYLQAFFQPVPLVFELVLSLDATSFLSLYSRISSHVCNTNAEDILISKATPLSLIVSTSFHDFELYPSWETFPTRSFLIIILDRFYTQNYSKLPPFSQLPFLTICLFDMWTSPKRTKWCSKLLTSYQWIRPQRFQTNL